MSYQNPLEALEKFQTIKPNPGKPQTTRPVIQALMYRENTWESIFTSNMMYLYTGPAITLRLVEKTTKDIADENEQNTRGELVAKEETDYDKEQGMGNAHDTKDNHNVEGESGEEQQGLVTDSGASGCMTDRDEVDKAIPLHPELPVDYTVLKKLLTHKSPYFAAMLNKISMEAQTEQPIEIAIIPVSSLAKASNRFFITSTKTAFQSLETDLQ